MSQVSLFYNSKNRLMFFDKRFGTNFFALFLIILGIIFSEPWGKTVMNTGLFALSGAITNWLAIYMLFEKIPGIYGSGIIPLHFEDFKNSIHDLIMNQFFNVQNFEKFFKDSRNSKYALDFEEVFQKVNFDSTFDSLLEVIESSSFGPMLSIIGGVKALQSLREPFVEKLKIAVLKISETQQFQDIMKDQLSDLSDSKVILKKVDGLVCNRLEELTPEMVKAIIERMISEHLGWLVVWGGVFGGLIGMITSLIFEMF